jgi:hypothetical protein
MNDEYKRGWYDGFQAAKAPHAVPPNLTGALSVKCAKCGMTFQGYYCSDTECPTFLKVRCG